MTASTVSLSAATVRFESVSSGRDIVCCFMSVFKSSGHEKPQMYCGGNLLDKVRQGPQGCLCFHRRVVKSERHKAETYRNKTHFNARCTRLERNPS